MGLPTPLFHLISSPKKKGKPERSGNRGGNSAVGLVRGPGSERHSGRRMPLYSSNSGGIAGADLGKVLATFETTIDPALSNRHLARSGNQASLWIKIGYSPRHHNEQMMRMDRDDWWKKPHYINHMFYRNNDRFLVMEIWPSS